MLDEDDATRKVTEWLLGQGYPLEMLVARGLRNVGFTVAQSDHYIDIETGKVRETDVAARRGHMTVGWFSLQIECKMSEGKPWVLFANPDWSAVSTQDRPATSDAQKLIRRFTDAWDGTLLSRGGQSPAYGLTQAFTSGSDVAYAAAQTAVKAAVAQVQWLVDRLQAPSWGFVVLAIPVVVVQGRLFEASLNQEDLDIREVPSGVIAWPSPTEPQRSYAVDVVTKAGLPDFERRARATALKLEELMPIVPQPAPELPDPPPPQH